jgi:phosphatidylserine/phosphatidylglycerophosphate/cardiolipin synthase-like enzyme
MKDTLAATGTVRGVYFSLGTTPDTGDPQFDCAYAIVDLFNTAQKSAHVAIYGLTEPRIVQAMLDAHQRGVEVALVADREQSAGATQKVMIQKLMDDGVDVRLAIHQPALMHNKVGIFDGQTICTGSFNWTTNAEAHNDENLLVVDGPDVAADYEKYVFQRILTTETLVRPQ